VEQKTNHLGEKTKHGRFTTGGESRKCTLEKNKPNPGKTRQRKLDVNVLRFNKCSHPGAGITSEKNATGYEDQERQTKGKKKRKPVKLETHYNQEPASQ